MNKYFNKYTKQYSYIFLAAYLFLIALTIFHYHHYDFQQGNYNFEQVPENQTTNPFDKYFALNGDCIVLHFTKTIDNINYVPVLNSESVNIEIYLSLNTHNRVPKLQINNNHYLRAPPSKFS